VPYGVYDIAANAGWVSVGIDHDTAALAVNSICVRIAQNRPEWAKIPCRFPARVRTQLSHSQ
jgi:hypothetical protein